jgi:predicted lipid-binding transport protein (Tim44 family)
MRDAHDIWTFARDVRASDPNWNLVATTYGEA